MNVESRDISQHHIETGTTERLQRGIETLMLGDYLYKDVDLGEKASIAENIATVSVWSDGVTMIRQMGFNIILIEPWGNGSGLLVEFTN